MKVRYTGGEKGPEGKRSWDDLGEGKLEISQVRSGIHKKKEDSVCDLRAGWRAPKEQKNKKGTNSNQIQ